MQTVTALTKRLRKCLDCIKITVLVRGRCDDCRSAHERVRGTKRERGYDAQFDRNRRDPTYLAATHCATCGQPFTEDNPRTAGHVTSIREGGGSEIKPECRRCNYGWKRTGS